LLLAMLGAALGAAFGGDIGIVQHG
jgi:hypothetical protein